MKDIEEELSNVGIGTGGAEKLLDFTAAKYNQLVIHRVGNKTRQESILLSHMPTELTDDSVRELMLHYLLGPFRNVDPLYQFDHKSRLELNEVYTYVREVFEDLTTFHQNSINIARHLYESSVHPRVQGGEFYMMYLTDCIIDDVCVDAIGLFKTENKETYLKVVERDQQFGVDYERGININRLDKGCIVLNLGGANGFQVAILDAHSRIEEEAQYWKDRFLGLRVRDTPKVQTEALIDALGQFTKQVYEDNEDKSERVKTRSRSYQYLRYNDSFDLDRFAENVFSSPEERAGFKQFKAEYEAVHDLKMPNSFVIEPHAVKTSRRKLRNFIQLDNSFDITVKATDSQILELVERGFDRDKNMQYYKIFFNHEK